MSGCQLAGEEGVQHDSQRVLETEGKCLVTTFGDFYIVS